MICIINFHLLSYLTVDLCSQTCGVNSACYYNGSSLTVTFSCICLFGYLSPQNNGANCMNVINKCASNNGGCSHICNYVGPGSASCSCNFGYKISNSNTSACVPINPCSKSNSGCPQVCVNTRPGLYYCSCSVGQYSPNQNGTNCQLCKKFIFILYY